MRPLLLLAPEMSVISSIGYDGGGLNQSYWPQKISINLIAIGFKGAQRVQEVYRDAKQHKGMQWAHGVQEHKRGTKR